MPQSDPAVNRAADLSPEPTQIRQSPDSPDQKGDSLNGSSLNRSGETGSGKKGTPDSEADWQVIEFPNAISLNDIPGALPESEQSAPPSAPLHGTPEPAAGQTPGREAELLSLVRDLNECNDVLLGRVTQLEAALETAQTALQSEIERAQQSHNAAGVQQNQVTRAAQHQIAQLVSELDTAEQALKRQQRLNETLQTELSVSQDRIAQLERECALVQQQHGEQSQTLIHAEAACRDLRSRLQRQQRYTLQFKVALEKSLNASSQRSLLGEETATVEPAVTGPAPVTMPKAQRIQPWALDSAPFEPVDSHLESLIRGLNSRAQPTPDEAPAMSEPKPLDPEAEIQLWQDLERVIDSSAIAKSELGMSADALEDSIESDPIAARPLAEAAATPAPEPLPEPLAEAVEAAFETVPAAGPSASSPPPSPFTEPSPWGQPLTSLPDPPQSASPQSVSAQVPATEPSLPAAARARPSTDPAVMASEATSSPAPVVYPLRPQKRVPSLAAVELPSFPKKASSD